VFPVTKKELLDRFAQSAEERLILARLLDRRALAEERGIPGVSGFLSPAEQVSARALLTALPPLTWFFSGGFPDAERRAALFLPDWLDEETFTGGADFPLCAFSVTVPPQAAGTLTHRDYLGSLTGLGLTREKIGDILVRERGAQVLLLRDVAGIVSDQWESVGRYPLTQEPLPLSGVTAGAQSVQKIRDTVASLRLDAVLSAGFLIQRSRAAQLVTSGRVLLNHNLCEKPDKTVAEGDVLSCRGLGKCVLKSARGHSKKGRVILELERYN
jgi:RNA-binding protein YlmH